MMSHASAQNPGKDAPPLGRRRLTAYILSINYVNTIWRNPRIMVDYLKVVSRLSIVDASF